MNPAPSGSGALTLPPGAVSSFAVRCSQAAPQYHQLSLEDAHGCIARWAIPLPPKQLAKQPVLLWLLPAGAAPDAWVCVETGPVQQAPARLGAAPGLRAGPAQGRLQLNFDGRLLRGYHCLRRLPDGNGHLWQLAPIG